MRSWSAQTAVLLLRLVAISSAAASAGAPTYAGVRGEVVLDNPRVQVEKLVLQPGQSTGRHGHPADQLLVFIKGGVLKSADTGRAVLWRDGRVVWQSATEPADGGSTNAGTAPIVMIWVTLKDVTPARSGAAGQRPHAAHLNYPNIPGEDLLENDRVIVQRFIVNPGQWEGRHAHGPNMLYIHVKGGQWAARSKKEPEHLYPDADPDGAVGWMAPIDISEGHESGNAGKEPIDLIWVTLKD
jgi:predicted metal-dependent enzyme (double-stranded beta helix superfamily)